MPKRRLRPISPCRYQVQCDQHHSTPESNGIGPYFLNGKGFLEPPRPKEEIEVIVKARKEKEQSEWGDRLAKKAKNKLENEALNIGLRSAKKLLKNFLK